MPKQRVGVIYGGRSGEHEVSIVSASSICTHLDPARYELVPIHIQKDGQWVIADRPPSVASAADVTNIGSYTAPGSRVEPTVAIRGLDVVFPVLHGPYGEDGTVQGLLELSNVPYVGAGVLGSAMGMDKAVMKTIFAAHALPIVPHLTVMKRDWTADATRITEHVASRLRYPVFVKPANLGSSVGISKATCDDGFREAMTLALRFDKKIVIETGVPNVREIECAVLGNDDPEASLPGEVIVTHRDGFYSYTAKYIDASGATTKVPADLSREMQDRVRRLSIDAFRALELAGMARVDFFLDRTSDALYLNEVNTIPGFTSISMYPQMWAASGLPYPKLLDRLLELAVERHADKQTLDTSIT